MTYNYLLAESAHLLGRLIKACPRLVLPYVSPILKALVAKLRITPQLQITVATAAAPNKVTLVQGPLLCCLLSEYIAQALMQH